MPRRGRRPVETRSIFYVIMKRKKQVALCLMAAVIPVLYLNHQLPPVYQTSTTILVGTNSETTSPLDLLAAPVTKSALVNQIEEIKSIALAKDVVRALPARTTQVLLARYKGPEGKEAKERWLVKYVNRNLDADVIRESDVIVIKVKANDPKAVVSVANTLTGVVANRDLLVRREEISGVKKFLEEQLHVVRQRLKVAEDSLNTYKRKAGIVALDKESEALLEKLTKVEILFNEATTERGAYEQKRAAILAQIAGEKKQLVPSVGELTSPWISRLKENLVDLQVQYTTMDVQGYSEKHPEMLKIQAEIEDTKRKLTNEVMKLATERALVDPVSRLEDLTLSDLELQIDIQSLKAKEEALRNVKVSYERELNSLPQKELLLARLARAKEVNEKIYVMLLEKYEEARIAEAGKIGNIRVIDPAEEPRSPISPNKLLNLFMGLLVGLGAGVALSLYLESTDVSIRSMEDVQAIVDLRVLGQIPGIRALKTVYASLGDGKGRDNKTAREISRKLVTYHDPRSPAAEAYRTLRTNLKFSNEDGRLRTLLICSPNPLEGKSITSVNLAVSTATAGSKTLIVDGDLRRPVVHRVFGVPSEPGLADLLLGKCSFMDALRKTEVRNLLAISSGSKLLASHELLGSPAARKFVEFVRQHFDLVIFDSPPILPVTDAALLARLVDGTIIIVKSGRTPRGSLLHAKNLFDNANANILGVVVNDLDLRGTYGYYGYRYHYYYYGTKHGKRPSARRTPERDQVTELLSKVSGSHTTKER